MKIPHLVVRLLPRKAAWVARRLGLLKRGPGGFLTYRWDCCSSTPVPKWEGSPGLYFSFLAREQLLGESPPLPRMTPNWPPLYDAPSSWGGSEEEEEEERKQEAL